MSEQKLYAVVQFSVDEFFSEIPTNWIHQNDENMASFVGGLTQKISVCLLKIELNRIRSYGQYLA